VCQDSIVDALVEEALAWRIKIQLWMHLWRKPWHGGYFLWCCRRRFEMRSDAQMDYLV